MEEFPVFMRLAIHSPNFYEECTTFNNILSMGGQRYATIATLLDLLIVVQVMRV
jgi:hypothetical protein